jgi:hypothetical protein
MLKNWSVAKKEREEELSGIYYATNVNDADIGSLINDLNVNVG